MGIKDIDDEPFLKRNWYDFRQGHNIYFVYGLSFVSYITVYYTLFMPLFPFLQNIFGSIIIFGIVFAVTYIPLAIEVGRLHRKKQLSTDLGIPSSKNPYTLEIMDRLQRILDRMDEIERRLP